MRFLSITEGIVLSICLHLLLMGLSVLYNLDSAQLPAPQTIAIDFIETPKASAVTEVQRKKSVPSPQKQIVEQAEKAKNNEIPEDTRFLSAYNQKVDKQSIAKDRGEFKNVEKPSSNQAMKAPGERSAQKQQGGEKQKPKLHDLSPAFNPLAIKERQQEKSAKQAQGGDFEAAEGGDVSQTDDYIKDVNQGSQTMLNTREFKYYTYYSRIRRQLSQHWEPKVRDKLTKLFRQGRNIASNQDHITKLLIILNQQGLLVGVQILSESGVRDLDDAAMEAFRSAAPFPNPPKGIIETDGTVKIRWDFVLES